MKKAKIEKKLAKALFNDKERAVIMNSLYYSVHKYKQHGDTDNAVFVQAVANRVAEVFDVQNQKYTKAEVDAIVENALNEAKNRAMMRSPKVGRIRTTLSKPKANDFSRNGNTDNCAPCSWCL